jgi:hypothetical protein
MVSTTKEIQARIGKKNNTPKNKKTKGDYFKKFLIYFSAEIIGAGVILGIFLIFQKCSGNNNPTGTPLSSLIDNKHRYQFLHDPSDADWVGEIDRYNTQNFDLADLYIDKNGDEQSITITSAEPERYSGDVTLHYDTSPYIHLDE